jgi:hypothetical protein
MPAAVKEKIVSVNLDANESMFFARELEAIKARTYDILYPELKMLRLVPISFDAGPGAETITYRQYDSVGVMKIIANYADDLPRADVTGKEFTSKVKSLGGSYGYNVQEIRAARMAGKPLEQRRANAVRMANDQAINRIAWFADGSAAWGGLYGLLFAPNVTKAAAVVGTWSSATADQIIGDVNALINNIRTLTKGVENADTVILPIAQYAKIASTPRSSTSDTTILEFLRRVHPGVTFEDANELATVTPNPRTGLTSANCMVAYRRSPDKLTLETPQAFEQFPAQERNLEFVVPCHSRVGGIVIYYPLSIAIVDGI